MKHIFLLVCCLVLALQGHAQVPYVPAKNAVQIGSDYIGLDPANGLKYRFAFDYRRYTARDRIAVGLSVGFMGSQRTTVLVPDFVSVGKNTRRRITIDMTASYNLLHSVHHALRIGVGPSIWHTNDDVFLKVEPYPVPSGTPIYAQRLQVKDWDFGGHSTVEYTYALSLNTQVSLHTGAVIIGPSGFSPLFGMRAGYRF